MFKKLFQKGKKKSVAMFAMMMALFAVAAIPASASSQAIDFSGSTGFSFSLTDIMNSAWSWIGQFNTYVIFVLALILVPALVGFILWIVSKVPRFKKSNN